jgi:hypothetical protein
VRLQERSTQGRRAPRIAGAEQRFDANDGRFLIQLALRELVLVAVEQAQGSREVSPLAAARASSMSAISRANGGGTGGAAERSGPALSLAACGTRSDARRTGATREGTPQAVVVTVP